MDSSINTIWLNSTMLAMILTALFGAISLFVVSFIARHFKLKSQLPPGPKGLPILGNIVQFLQSENNTLVSPKCTIINYWCIWCLDYRTCLFLWCPQHINSQMPKLQLLEEWTKKYDGVFTLWFLWKPIFCCFRGKVIERSSHH